MKLYDGGRSPNPRRVRVYLAEKGLSLPLQPIDLATDQHKTETFSAINPMRQVPALELDDGTVITESIAICRYFEELHPAPPLFGEGAKGRAVVEMWQRRLELGLLFPAAHVFRHTNPGMAPWEVPQVPAWGEANRGHIERFLAMLDRHLEGRTFVAGETFSVADITGLIAIDFFRAGKVAAPTAYANVVRWHAALAARPSAKA